MASTYLSRTQSTSPTSAKIGTISFWVKRGTLGDQHILNGYTDTNNRAFLNFTSDDRLQVGQKNSGTTVYQIEETPQRRDVSAWYHCVFAFDTTDGTASNRFKLYVNGSQVTDFTTNNEIEVNEDIKFFNLANLQLGRAGGGSNYFDGSLAHFHYADGTAYDASTFGETDATTGIWKPKTAPSVTYGTNGFFLKFENSAAFGTDSSGNSNNFTVNGTMTQNIDTPSNVFSTINPLNSSETSSTFFFTSLGNTELTAADNDSTRQMGITLNPENMKGYFEMKVAADNNWQIHVQDITRRVTKTPYDNTSNPTYRYTNNGTISYGTGAGWTNLIASYTSASSTGDIVGVAFDFTGSNKNVWFHLNGTYGNNGSGVGNPATGDYPALTASNLNTADHYAFLFSVNTGGSDSSVQANFGNGYFGTTAVSSAENPDDGIGIFEYAVPTGYKALCTKSINAQEYD